MVKTTMMNRDYVVLIIGTLLYGLTFNYASYLFELYLVHIKGPALPFAIFEQSLISFVFGFVVYKNLSFHTLKSIFIVLILPFSLFLYSYLKDMIDGIEVNISDNIILFLLIVILQPVFILVGAYVQYCIKRKDKNK